MNCISQITNEFSGRQDYKWVDVWGETLDNLIIKLKESEG